MASENLPKLQLSEKNVSDLIARVKTFRAELETHRNKVRDELTHLGDPGEWQSGKTTRDNLVNDAWAICDKLDKYIAYLNDVEAMVHGDGQRLLSS